LAFIIRIYQDARSSECQTYLRNVKLETPTNLHENIILGNEFLIGEIKVKK